MSEPVPNLLEALRTELRKASSLTSAGSEVMAEADLRDQLEQARRIAVALEQQNAAGLALHERWQLLAPAGVTTCRACAVVARGYVPAWPCPTALALDPVAAELAEETP